jgi:predicted Zn-dependent protease
MNMIDRIKKILADQAIENWKIIEDEISSRELFFIKKDLDMNRAKDVTKYSVTLYRDFEEESTQYRGSAQVSLSSQASDEELLSTLEKAYLSASFVKNPWYPLAKPEKSTLSPIKSQFSQKELTPVLKKLQERLYVNDTFDKGGINSAEIFVNKYKRRFLNSEGIDVTFPRYQGDIELICDWKEGSEEVEIYNMFSFSDVDSNFIETECRDQIEHCRLRSLAEKSPDLKNIPIILTGEAVKETMGFYLTQSSAKMVFEKVGRGKIGEVFQEKEGKDEGVKGDLISITLEPEMEGSPHSAPYDSDGVALKRTEIFKEGKLLSYHGNLQYAHYLNVPASGSIKNISVTCGGQSVETWKKKPHVEILSFSNFQMDPITGDFGGEVRLALWFDGKETKPLTGASLSATLFDVQKEIYLSAEGVRKEGYDGPAYLMFPGGHLAG